MTRLAANSQRRAGFTLIELLVVIAIMTILIALLIPAVQQVRNAAQRTQTTNNLHQCSLAAIAFHDANGWLPYNGTAPGSGVTDSGSWAYQILPYIEQQNVFSSQTSTSLPSSWGTAIVPLLDPMRPRVGYFSGALSPSVTVTGGYWAGSGVSATQSTVTTTVVGAGSSGTLTIPAPPLPIFPPLSLTAVVSNGATGTLTINGTTKITFPSAHSSTVAGPATVAIAITGGTLTGDSGPATDFGINPFLNVPNGGTVNAANNRCTLLQITDGTSNTILIGEMYCATSDYAVTAPGIANVFAQSTKLPIFQGGTWATTRNGLGNSATTWLQDGTATTSNQWGGPMPNGAMAAMADGSVHLIPYSLSLQNLLEPNDGNTVVIP